MAIVGLRVRANTDDLAYMQRELAKMPDKIGVAMASAINSTLTRCRKIIVGGVADATTIKNKSRIVKGTTIHRASKKNPSGYINILGRPVGAVQFANIVSKTLGVMYTVSKHDNPQRFAHGFKGVGLGAVKDDGSFAGNTHLWIRYGPTNYTNKGQTHYLPNLGRKNTQRIRPLYGARLTEIYTRNPQIRKAAEVEASKVLRERMYSQVDRFLKRTKAALPEPVELADAA